MVKGLAIAVEIGSSRRIAARANSPTLSRRGSLTSRPLAAAAMLEFEVNAHGLCRSFALHGLDYRTAGEPALVTALERRLASIDRVGGRLVTLDGQRDLGIIRLAAMRTRQFSIGGAAGWLRDERDCHEDMTLVLSPISSGRRIRLGWPDASAEDGATAWMARGPARRELVRAELDVLRTMVIYLHVLAERHGSVEPLSRGVAAMGDMLSDKVGHGPHLNAILRTDVFRLFAAPVF